MRILLAIHHALDPNAGAPGATLQIGAAFGKLGHHVEYLSWDDMPARWSPRVKEALFPEFLAAAMRGRGRFDVVDATGGDLWLWGRVARLRRGARQLLVTRTHGLEHRFSAAMLREAAAGGPPIGHVSRVYHHRLRLREVAASLRVAHLALFMNEGDRRFAIDRLRLEPNRARSIANGLPERFVGLPFEPVPASAPVRIAQIGSFHARKGVRYGVPALSAVLADHPDARVSWLGSGAPAEEVLSAFAPAVRARVDVTESFDHARLPELLAGHQINLFPSLAEGFSLALIEAMACGLAPVATTETADGTVIDGSEGLLVPAFDRAGIERALRELIGDRERLERLRAAAHEKAQRFTWAGAARAQTALYDEAIGRLR